ncbi:hypothetical protein EG329_003520 [Mollisiaceae sp. DMI_Dod_QoI]|nr:hypothetical protein EG329_003520 [Helotiales sp. DMI_Dod_QoI]
MERPFPWAANLSSLNKLFMQRDIDLDSLWEMVFELNSRTGVLMNRIEASRNLHMHNGVAWMSLGMLCGFCTLVAVGKGVIYLFRGPASEDGQHGKMTLVDVLENGHGKGSIMNGNGDLKMVVEEELSEIAIFKLREELEAARDEITNLMSYRDESDGLRSKLELYIKEVEDYEMEQERLSSFEKDLAGVRFECETLKEDIKAKDIEMAKFSLFEIEVRELRSHLQACKEEVATKDQEIESLRTKISSIEHDLETAQKDLENAAQRAAESFESEQKLRDENGELAQRMENLREEHAREAKALQETHENNLSKQQLAHEQEKQSLKEEYEGKVRQAREGMGKRPESPASSIPADPETSPGRRTPTRFLASLKRHSRSSLSGSFTENSSRGSGSSSRELRSSDK